MTWMGSSKKDLRISHAFQKKSKKGIATPQHELDVIEGRLKAARQLHARRASGRENR